jgi:RHS repeat-associated protein
MTAITHTFKPGSGSSTTLATYTYGYNAASELTIEANQDGSYTYTYDKTGQLTGVDASGGTCGATGCDESFSYDVNGNRTMTGYTTGTGNRLTSDGTYNYTYDDNGNMLTKTRISDSQKYEFTFDYRNRLTQVVLKNSGGTILQQTDFTYDAFNQRIIKSFDDDGPLGPHSAAVTKTIYDGAGFGANPYADFDGSNALTMRYLYGPAVDLILGRRSSGGTVAWHLADHLGTVRDLVNTSGTGIDHILYSTYGKVTAETQSSNGDRFKYTGREYDSESAQYYYRARVYDAAIGRFSSQDPIGFAGGDSNLYRYVENAPTLAADPSGLYAEEPPPPSQRRTGKALPDEEINLGKRRSGATLTAGSIPVQISSGKKTNQEEMYGPASLFSEGGQMVTMAVPGPIECRRRVFVCGRAPALSRSEMGGRGPLLACVGETRQRAPGCSLLTGGWTRAFSRHTQAVCESSGESCGVRDVLSAGRPPCILT